MTEPGTIRDEREVQPENAYFPIDFTELPMVTDEREVQPENA